MFDKGIPETLTEDVLEDALNSADAKARTDGLHRLGVEDRYLFASALARLPIDVVDHARSLPDISRTWIRSLEATGRRTYARTAAAILAPLVEDGRIYEVDRSPLPAGPAALFVPAVGGQYPVRGGTVGNRFRRVLGIQPPIGSFYVASWLALLGVDVRAFNLELGQSEFDACEAALHNLGERVYFMFSASNFYTSAEIESMMMLADMCGQSAASGFTPRLVGVGYSPYFCRSEYFDTTPVDVIVGPHGEPSEADMIFGKYQGPTDDRPAFQLFKDIPNLHLRAPEGSASEVYETAIVPLTQYESRLISGSLDVRLMELDTKYWTPTNIMDVCAPDDLSIPLELSDLEQITVGDEPEPDSRTATTARAKSSLSLSNFVHRPNAIKMMTVFGSCPRGCEFCQLTQWGERLYFYSGREAIDAMNEAVKVYPDLKMFIFEDDDFLLRRSHVDHLVAALRGNGATKGRVFYVSTVPMEVAPDTMYSLRDVGFRAMLLGLESPVERVARQIGKFSDRYNFDHVLEAPKIAHDTGLHIRITAIPFYPLVQEDDLSGVIDGLTDFMDYGTGISVAVHPLVRAAPGIELAKSRSADITRKEYTLPDGSGRTISLLGFIMPNDPVVKTAALDGIRGTSDHLSRILEEADLVGRDYPSSLGVLALFRSTIESWRRAAHRSVDDAVLDGIDDRVTSVIGKMVHKHEVLSDVKRCLDTQDVAGTIGRWLGDADLPYVFLGLRMAADFGDNDDVLHAAHAAHHLAQAGLGDWSVNESLRYAAHRFSTGGDQLRLWQWIDGLVDVSRPEIRQSGPKLLPVIAK